MMTAIMAVGFFVLLFIAIGKTVGFRKPEADQPHHDGIMVKTIKVTMGVCIGLTFFAVLYFVGWAAVLSTISGK